MAKKRGRPAKLGRGVKERKFVPWITAPGGLLYNQKHGLPPGTPPPPKPPKPYKPPTVKPPQRNLPAFYTPYHLKLGAEQGRFTEADIKKEYTRLRKMMTRRLAVLEKAGRTDTRAYQYNKGRYGPISQLSAAHLRKNLSDLYRELIGKDITPQGQDQQMQEHAAWLNLNYGIDLQSRDDWRQFGEMLDYVREGSQDRMYYKLIMEAIGDRGIRQLYQDWRDNRFDPLNPPAEYV